MDQLETPAEFKSNRSESPDAPDENRPTQKIRSSPARILRTLVIGFAIALSLLAFPSVLPWMIAGWLVVFTITACRGRIAWAPLAICLSVLIIRLVPRTPAMLVMGVLLLLVVVLRFRRGHSATARTPQSIAWIALLWIAWVAVLWEHHCIQTCARPHFYHFDERSPIVCVGDSLTDGMRPDLGYPDALDKMLPNPVINEGFSGIATRQGLDLMPRVLKHDPKIVIIELGGHDFLKGHSRASTKSNLLRMIALSRERGAEVILMEIPRGFMFDPFASLEREIAYETDVQLISDTWLRQIILMSPIAPPGMWMSPETRLSDDGIHSNPKGSRVIATRVAKAVEELANRGN